MDEAVWARTAQRAVMNVSGPEAESFLDGLLTQSVKRLSVGGAAAHGALLTPQGKVIRDLFILRTSDHGYHLDVPANDLPGFMRRLKMFKLRAKVDLALREDWAVGLGPQGAAWEGEGYAYDDPRNTVLGRRVMAPANAVRDNPSLLNDLQYRRIAAGIPDFGIDYAPETTFPADIGMDVLAGVDFKKGCFVGQEVVSRMKRKSNVRKRHWPVVFTDGDDAPEGDASILAEAGTVGELCSRHGPSAIARLRIDRVEAALNRGETLTCDERPVSITRPAWDSEPETAE